MSLVGSVAPVISDGLAETLGINGKTWFWEKNDQFMFCFLKIELNLFFRRSETGVPAYSFQECPGRVQPDR